MNLYRPVGSTCVVEVQCPMVGLYRRTMDTHDQPFAPNLHKTLNEPTSICRNGIRCECLVNSSQVFIEMRKTFAQGVKYFSFV